MNRRIKYSSQAGLFLEKAKYSDAKKIRGLIGSLTNMVIENTSRHYSFFDVGLYRVIFKITPKTAFIMLIGQRTDGDMYRMLGLKPVLVS